MGIRSHKGMGFGAGDCFGDSGGRDSPASPSILRSFLLSLLVATSEPIREVLGEPYESRMPKAKEEFEPTMVALFQAPRLESKNQALRQIRGLT